jgi:hypothetical protein
METFWIPKTVNDRPNLIELTIPGLNSRKGYK